MKRIVLSVCAAVAAAVSAQAEDLQGLVAYWPFTDGFADASGGGNNLTGFNVTTSDGFARFELVDDGKTWAQTSSQVVLSPYDAVTYSLWVRRIVDHGADIIFEQTEKSNLTGRGGAAKVTWKDEDHFAATINNTSSKTALRTTSAINCSDEVWHHVVAVYDKTASHPDNVTLYVDGEKNSILDSTNAAETKDVAFCNGIFYLSRRAGSAGDSEGVACDMDDVRIYGAHKSASAVKALYYGGLSLVYNNDETKYAHLLPDGVTSRDGTAMCRLRLGSESLQLSFNGAPAQAGNRELALPVGTVCTLVAVGTIGDVAWTGLPADAVVDPTTRMARFVIADPLTVAAELTSGELVAHWPFEGEDGLADASGNGYTLSANGMSTTDGFARFAKAADGRVWAQTTKALSLSPYGTVSYSLWIRNLDPSAGDIIFEVSPKGNATGRWGAPRVVYKKDRSEPYFAAVNLMKGNSIHYSSGVLCEGNDWHQLTVVYKRNAKNPENVRIYVDGKLDSTPDANEHADAEDIPFLDDILYLARRAGSSGTTAGLAGDMDEFKVFGGVMSTVDIAREYYLGLQKVYQDDPEKLASLLPDGCRLQNGQIQFRVRLSSNTPASINGQEAQTGVQEHWVTLGSACSAEVAVPVNGGRIGWKGVPEFVAFGEQDARAMFTVVEPMSVVVDAFTPTHVWTGAASTDFASAANWTNATADAAVAAPGVGDDVYIPAGCANQPTAATPFSVRSFRLGRLAGESGTATFTANTALTNVVSGDVVVYAGGVLTHTGPASSPTKKLILQVGGNMTVCADGRVSADDCGYSSGRRYPGASNSGRGTHDYDAIKTPCMHGSGGNSGGGGGGVIRLMASGTLAIDGRVSADAPSTPWVSGAGGAVWLSAARFAGHGVVSAAGGGTDGAQVNANGCGGRVALYATESDGMFAGRVRAPCGYLKSATAPTTSSDGVGQTGTVYLQAGDGPGDLILDNEIYTVGSSTTIKTDSTDGADIAFHHVIVTNRSRLNLPAGLTLRVTGDWRTTGGCLTADASTHVYFEGADTANVCGDNTFGSVTCVAPGKAFRFGTGASDNFAIPEGCSLVWQGAANNLISLWPSAPDGIWKLCVAKNATYDFSYLSVSNSNASAGQGLTAPHSENMGGNTYWSFANPAEEGDPITWTGEVDTDWFNSANWVDRYGDTRGVAPGDRVSIPSAPTNQPVARAGDIAVCDLTVEAGASLELDRANLTVTNAISVLGSLTADGNERISCLGSVAFAGASTYSGARATFALTGNVAQDVMFGGKSFGIFEITKNGGEVRFADGLTADMFSLLAQGPFAVEYRSGATYAFGEFMASGYVGGEPAVSFRASVTESPWMVSASRMSYVAGVSVSDSTAVGTAIRADVGCSLTSCVNWTQGEGACRTWKGGDGNFNTPSAWSPEGVPGPLDMVQVYTRSGEAPKITVGDARTVAELVVSGAGSPTLIVTGPFHVTGDAEIVGKATVQMNSRNAWTVDGDLTFRTGSTLTQTTPASNDDVAKYSISVDVGGDFTMEPGTVVNAEAMGAFAKASVGGTPASWGAGSHGGRADYASYDSILAPVMYGGCGGGAKGGGVIRLACGGTMRLDGLVNADGGKNTSDGKSDYSGAGGSIWLTCGLLTGSGTVSARGGGWDCSASSYAGAGGRISVWQEQDEDAFTGIFAVRGGEGTTSGSGIGGGAGSVYVSRGGDSKVGTVTFANYNKVVQSSNFPMKDDGDAKKVYRGVTVVVTNAAWLALTGNVTIRELELASNAKVELGTNTLTIISQAHKGFKGWPKGASIISNQVDGVWGGIVWKKPGFALIIR